MDSLRSGAKDRRGVLHEKASEQIFFQTPILNFAERVTSHFFVLTFFCISREIATSHLCFKSLVIRYLPRVEKLTEEEVLRSKDYLKDQKIFIIVEESDINGKQYVNILNIKLAASE